MDRAVGGQNLADHVVVERNTEIRVGARFREVISEVSFEDVAMGIDKHIERAVQSTASSGRAVRGVSAGWWVATGWRGAREQIDIALGRGGRNADRCRTRSTDHNTDGVVAAVRDVQVSVSIERTAVREMQVGTGGLATI